MTYDQARELIDSANHIGYEIKLLRVAFSSQTSNELKDWLNKKLEELRYTLEQKLDRIIMTQQELADKLAAATAKINNVGNDIDLLMVRVKELQDAIENNPVPPAVENAANALETALQAADDKYPGNPNPGPVPPV